MDSAHHFHYGNETEEKKTHSFGEEDDYVSIADNLGQVCSLAEETAVHLRSPTVFSKPSLSWHNFLHFWNKYLKQVRTNLLLLIPKNVYLPRYCNINFIWFIQKPPVTMSPFLNPSHKRNGLLQQKHRITDLSAVRFGKLNTDKLTGVQVC